MKKLKVASPTWLGYTGPLGNVAFVDGVSVDFLPRVVRDRLSASMEFVEIDEEGNEAAAGVAHRLVDESAARAPVIEPMERQSDEDKKSENVKAVLEGVKNAEVNTREELEEIAAKGGIKALREVADRWGVKHRSIPVLIEMILGAQDSFVAARNKKLEDAATAELEGLGVKDVETSDYVGGDDHLDAENPDADGDGSGTESDSEQKAEAPAEDEALKLAAASGDLAAAITEEDVPSALYGSSVLAATYEISGQTVQLGDIVRSAFELFGGTAGEWNALPEEDREALLRLDLDKRLAAEADQSGSE